MIIMGKKLCVIADLHGHSQTIRYLRNNVGQNCDYLLIAGDITEAYSDSLPLSVFDFLNSLGIPIIAVLGNSDRLEFLDEMSNYENIKILHFSFEYVEEIPIIGVSGIPPQLHGSNFFISEAKFYHGLKNVYDSLKRPDKFILLSHAPPFGFGDMARNGEHIGSRGLLKFDKEFKPKIHICGHVHEAKGIYELNGTLIINPGIQTPKKGLLKIILPDLTLENANDNI